jgi:hypothetical protein
MELIQKAGKGKLRRAVMTSFGVGLDSPILKLKIPADKLPRLRNFA